MDVLFLPLFLILPVLSLGLLFLKDLAKRRRLILNVLLIINTVLYVFPFAAAFFSTPEGESMFNENTGGGAFLWFYMILLPLCGIVFVVLLILKIIFAVSHKKQNQGQSNPKPQQ